MKGIDAHAEMA